MGFFKKTATKTNDYLELLNEINRTKRQMDEAYSNFQSAMDPDLIDCYIFESNAACKKYHFLLKKAKELKI